MRKTMIIPTYWCRKTGDPWQEGDAVYDHPTPVDQEGTLERTLVSMKQFHEKDFKLVILICPTTPEVEAANRHILRTFEYPNMDRSRTPRSFSPAFLKISVISRKSPAVNRYVSAFSCARTTIRSTCS